VMILLLHQLGIRGLAYSRLWYGLIPMLAYIPLLREIRAKDRAQSGEERLRVAFQEGSIL